MKRGKGIWIFFTRKRTVKEKIVDTVIGFGIPGATLFALIKTSSFSGAAAITSSLAILGIGATGMIGGICVLGVLMCGGLYIRPSIKIAAKPLIKRLRKRKKRRK